MVFISWAGKDREVKDVIVNRLREENFEYWESDESCNSDFSEECIKAIKRSSVFIVVVSNASMDPKSYVFNEICAAREMENEGLLNIVIYKICDEPLTDRFIFQLNHISDANHVSRIKKTGKLGGIDSLIKRVKELIKRRQEGFPEKPYDVITPYVAGTQISGSGFFVENSRRQILQKIDQAFERSNIIILSELFGFGKKSVVRKYAELHSEEFSTAVEVEAARDSLYNFFAVGLNFTNINEAAFEKDDEKEVIAQKISFLKKLEEQHLIVISDVDLGDEANEFICNQLKGTKCKIIFITQNSGEAYKDIYPIISVGRMDDEYLVELFFHHYNRANDAEKQQLLSTLTCFFEEIGGHTKTVELTASVLSRDMRAEPENLSEYLAVQMSDSTALGEKITDKLSEMIELESFDSDERRTLLIAALTALPVIDEKALRILMDNCNLDNYSSITLLDSHRWLTYNARNKTIFVEPIIARICAKKFMEYDDIPFACFDYFADMFVKSVYSSSYTANSILGQLERFFSLVQREDSAQICKTLRMMNDTRTIDATHMEELCARFEEARSTVSDDPARAEFDEYVSEWVSSTLMPIIRLSGRCSPEAIYSFAQNNETEKFDAAELFGFADSDEIQQAYGEIGELLDSLNKYRQEIDPSDESYICAILSVAILDDFFKRRYDQMFKKLDDLMDNLRSSPWVLEDEDACLLVVGCVKIICMGFENTGIQRSEELFLEKVIEIDWPVDIRYSFFVMYIKVLCGIDSSDERLLYALEAASEIFDDAMAAAILSEEAFAQSKKEFLLLYGIALCGAGDVYGAIEKFSEAQRVGITYMIQDALFCAESIVNQLIYNSDTRGALDFIRDNKDFFVLNTSSDIAENVKIAEDVLALEEMMENVCNQSFSAGGIAENRSYYQKYSSDMHNNPFVMMKYNRVADGVRRYDFSHLTNAQIAEHTRLLRQRALSGENRTRIVSEAFALVSEAGMRVLGYKHYYVQYVGAAVMLDGKIAEILNGEGKTYTIPLVAYVRILYGESVFVVDDSKYLTMRNYNWMRGLFEMLGVDAVHLKTTENSDFVRACKGEVIYTDMASLALAAIGNEISEEDDYINLSEYGVIIDEADTVLIDNAVANISHVGLAGYSAEKLNRCKRAYDLAEYIKDNDCYFACKDGAIEFKKDLYMLIEEFFDLDYERVDQSEQLKDAELLLRKALYFLLFYNEGVEYFVESDKIFFENKQNGAFFEAEPIDGYFLARKSGIENSSYMSSLGKCKKVINISYIYSFLKKFGFVCATSATVSSFRKEFKEIYRFDVVAVPPALPIARKDHTVSLFTNKEHKNAAIVEMIEEKHQSHQPVLLITSSIRESLMFSRLLADRSIPHKLLNATNSEKSPEILAEAGIPDYVLVTTTMANRGVDIKLGGDAERAALREVIEMGIDVTDIDKIIYTVPTDEIRQTELYTYYYKALEKAKAIVSAKKKKVVEAGGLCVICTEPYGDMRIEQQARGRSGRQGEAGESYIFESIDDEMFKAAISEKALAMYGSVLENEDIISSGYLSRAVEIYKKRLHHGKYLKLKERVKESVRVEKSKEYMLSVMHDVVTGKLKFNDLLEQWAQSETSRNHILEFLESRIRDTSSAALMLYDKYPDVFEGISEKDVSEALCTAGKKMVADSKKSEGFFKFFLVRALKIEWINHLQMIIADIDVHEKKSKFKMSEDYFAKKYEKDAHARLLKALEETLLHGI